MRSILFAICLILAATLPCRAQGDKQKPNTLSAKELADGWILLFDGETTFGWKAHSMTEPPILVDRTLVPTGSGAISATSEFRTFELRFEYKLDKQHARVGVYKALDQLQVNFHSLATATVWTPVVMRLQNTSLDLAAPSYKKTIPEVSPGNITFMLDKDSNLKLRNIKLKPLETKPIFNSRNLAGWREFPGKKSKFTVADKGEINVQDGPGDLQTTAKYKDFILQLECISHGKHLNSGIFFRCRDNEYQNGYEAQIRNQFTAEATQDYTLEEYDPKSNKLVEKKKIKATAVDYGTGAIYRRQPARKEMAKDGEWFSMTIVAQGNHLATWVNGVQVADWLDNRPKSDNPRTGCKLEAGHISIQGHDPTTNLSFRNLRIGEW